MNTQFSNKPLGVGRDLRRRFLLHHLPLAISSVMVFVVWMAVPIFQTAGLHGPPQGGQHQAQSDGHEGLRGGGGHHGGAMAGHHGDAAHAVRGSAMATMGQEATKPGTQHRPSMERVVTGTGYIALGFIALTLLIGPANLLLGRRVPVSNYLSRDVGTWAVVFSVVHTAVICWLAYVNAGSGIVASFLHFFVAPDGTMLTTSFGLGNWVGLAALLIAVGLLAISNDFALRTLKAKQWKRIQRLNYALFGLVIGHAIFYGVLSRPMSVSTISLDLSVVAVGVGQAVGIWLWRRRFHQETARSHRYEFRNLR